MPIISTENVIGNLATNAAFSLMGFSSIQVVKSYKLLKVPVLIVSVKAGWRYSKIVALKEYAFSSLFHTFYNMESLPFFPPQLP